MQLATAQPAAPGGRQTGTRQFGYATHRAAGKCAGEKGEAQLKCFAPDRSADVKVLASAVVQVIVDETVFDRLERVPVY